MGPKTHAWTLLLPTQTTHLSSSLLILPLTLSLSAASTPAASSLLASSPSSRWFCPWDSSYAVDVT